MAMNKSSMYREAMTYSNFFINLGFCVARVKIWLWSVPLPAFNILDKFSKNYKKKEGLTLKKTLNLITS